jgi:multisubunit Na+/H+ antiporter MnhF subunit
VSFGMGCFWWWPARSSCVSSVPDRIVAFDAFSTNLAVVVVVLVIRDDLVELIDVVLVLAILGFVGTMAVAKYLKKGDIVD